MFRTFLKPVSVALSSVKAQLFPGQSGPAVILIQAPSANQHSAFYGTGGAGEQIIELAPGATHAHSITGADALYAVGTAGDTLTAQVQPAT
jgi:hypothetical protein